MLLFDKDQSNSLNKLLYPEEPHSIAFQFFAIPLSYIPTLLRFITSFVLSSLALIKGKKYPFEPIKRVANFLFDKATRDLNRLIIFFTHLTYLAYTGLAVLPKALVNTVGLVISRIAAYFNKNPAHALNKTIASIHTFFRSVGEYFYPATNY